MADCSVTTPASQVAAQAQDGGLPDDTDWPAGQTFELVLERARQRDSAALSLLYRRFLPVIYRFLLSRVRDVPLAEDLTSETFFAVMEGLTSLRARDEMGFATWTIGIARNKLSQHFRRLSSRREIPMAVSDLEEPAATAEEDDPLVVITARESWSEVVAGLELLTPEQRTVLLHRCIMGRSADEVARLMGKPANAIYGLQFRALTSLSRHLDRAHRPDEQTRRGGERSRERRNGDAAGREA